MKTKVGAFRRLSKAVIGVSLVAMFIPALSAPASAENIQSLPETTCKEVLANWNLITIEQDGSITKDEALDSMDQSGSINVTTINQLYCIGAGAYAVDENNNLTQTGSNCNDGESILAELMHMKYTQVQDLDFKDLTVDGATKWRPIGNNGCQFLGEYDGNNKVINNLYFNDPDLRSDNRPYEAIGLFGSTGDNGLKIEGSPRSTAVIKNVILRNATIIGSDAVGGIVGIADDSTDLQNISVTGTIGVRREEGWAAGGLIGWANGTIAKPISISSSDTDVNVVVRESTDRNRASCAGGLVGYATATDIDESSSTVVIQSHHIQSAGGIAGCQDGGSITSSFARGSIAGNDAIGGLVGDARALRPGGQTPEFLTITDSFADVAVFGGNGVAGLLGWGEDITMDSSYAVGEVIGNGQHINGIIGEDWGSNPSTVTDTFWNVETTGIAIPDDPSTVRGTGKTTAQLRDITTFSGAGYDIGTGASSATTWRMIAGKNSDYPTLASQTPAPTCINVLEDWGMLSVDENATPTIVVDIDPAETYDVATINQLYCIGQGGFTLGGTPLTNRTEVRCGNERSKLSELMYATYVQTADLDFNQLTVDGATNWRPIGNNGCQFFGLYDGNDFDISNVRYNRPHVATWETPHEGAGLFGSTGMNDATLEGYTDRWATIKDVNLVDAYIVGWNDVGGFVGIADGKTELLNVSFTGTVGGSKSGYGDLGAIVGWANGENEKPVVIRDSEVDVELIVIDAVNQYGDQVVWCSGGIVGWASNVEVYDSVATTLANSNLHHSVGGIGGCLYGSLVQDSQATANLTSFETLGGVIAWAGEWDPDSGGVLQPVYTTIERSTADVSLTSGDKVGGLVGGSSHLIIRDSYAIGTISGDESVGGLVGLGQNITVQSSYTSVAVTAVSQPMSGGLIGNLDAGNATVADSFWDATVSGYSSTAGDKGTGKTTAELKTLSTFTGAGWDIVQGIDTTKVWGIATDRNNGYPFLQERPSSPSDPGNNDNNQNSGTGGTPTTSPSPTIQEQIQNRKLMESIPPAAFSQITPEQLATLPISSIRGITKQHAEVMTLAQLRALTPTQIRVLRPSTLATLPAEWLSKLSAQQIKFLLPRQIRALSQKQLQKFTAKQRSVIASVLRKATKQSK